MQLDDLIKQFGFLDSVSDLVKISNDSALWLGDTKEIAMELLRFLECKLSNNSQNNSLFTKITDSSGRNIDNWFIWDVFLFLQLFVIHHII